MAQPHKGPRRQVITRLPADVADTVAELAAVNELSLSEAVADLVAVALGLPKPSETLPRPKNPRRRTQREELALGMTA